MKNVIESLLVLQGLEMGPDPNSPKNVAEIKRLRSELPEQILGHYDRLRARDKKGVSLVRENGVCSECHMRLASGIYAELLRAEDIMICDSCGRYLLAAPEPPAPAAPEPPPAAKPAAKRTRKKKTPAAPAPAVE